MSDSDSKSGSGSDSSSSGSSSSSSDNESSSDEKEFKIRSTVAVISTAETKNNDEEPPAKKTKVDGTTKLLTSRTGGAYIPPAKLRMMQESISDKNRYVLLLMH